MTANLAIKPISKITFYIILSILAHLIVALLFIFISNLQRVEYEVLDLNLSLNAPVLVATPRQLAPAIIIPKVEKINKTIELTKEEVKEEKKEEAAPPPQNVAEQSNDSSEQENINYEAFYSVDTRPQIVKQPALIYPFLEKRQGKEGVVIIETDIDANGVLRDYRIIKSAGENFDNSAIAMITKSTFKPGFKNGKAVAVRMRFTVRFNLSNS